MQIEFPFPSEHIVITRSFYKSREWLTLRYLTLAKYGGKCQCCGTRPAYRHQVHVDHIKPISKFPHLALDEDNLQVLCSECNLGKSNIDYTDWRQAA
jgi:5-methylcytosine-specific restriction endonuclease McrA